MDSIYFKVGPHANGVGFILTQLSTEDTRWYIAARDQV